MSPRNLKCLQALATRYEKKISPPQKKIGQEEYISWKIMIQIQNCLGWGAKSEKLQKLQSESFFLLEICIHYFLYAGRFQVPPKKITPTLKANSHPKYQFNESPSYMKVLKNGSTHHLGGVNYDLYFFVYFCLFLPSQENYPDSQIIYTVSQEKVLTDVLNKLWFQINVPYKLLQQYKSVDILRIMNIYHNYQLLLVSIKKKNIILSQRELNIN